MSLDLKVPILAGKHDNRRHSTASFSGNELSNEFHHLRSVEGLISFNKNNSTNFSGESKER